MSAQTLFETTCSECNSKYKIPQEYIGKRGTCKNCGANFEMAAQPASQDTPVIGKLAVKYKFIDETQLEALLQELDGGDRERNCEKHLVEKGLISSKQLSLLKSARKYVNLRQRDRRFGNILLQHNFCDQQKIDSAFAKQSRLFQENKEIKPLGDILLEHGHLSTEQRDHAMGELGNIGDVDTESGESTEEPLFLRISQEGLSAHIQLSSRVSRKITTEDIFKFLETKGVTYGIVAKESIEAYLKSVSAKKKPFKIAEGTPPVPGRDADIRFYIDLDNIVKTGAFIAEKVPSVMGKPGTDVFGNAMAPPVPKEIPMSCGKGATLSEDGLKAYAESDGIPYVSLKNEISLHSELTISGDVDHTVGDIHFIGPITVNGTIKKGFCIRGNSLTANEIRGAEIDINGEINVSRGILDADIKSKGNIHALFVKGATIVAYGDLVVAKEIINSDVKISGECNIRNGKILSSSITARRGILVNDVGTDLASPSKLSPGLDSHIEDETSEILQALAEKKERFEALKVHIQKLEKANNRLNDEIVEHAQVQDRSMLEQRTLMEQIAALKKNGDIEALEAVETELKNLEAKAKKAEESISGLFEEQEKVSSEITDVSTEFDSIEEERHKLKDALRQIHKWSSDEKGVPVVKVYGSVMDGTILAGTNSSKELTKTYKNVELREKKSKVPGPEDRWEIRVMRKEEQEKEASKPLSD